MSVGSVHYLYLLSNIQDRAAREGINILEATAHHYYNYLIRSALDHSLRDDAISVRQSMPSAIDSLFGTCFDSPFTAGLTSSGRISK